MSNNFKVVGSSIFTTNYKKYVKLSHNLGVAVKSYDDWFRVNFPLRYKAFNLVLVSFDGMIDKAGAPYIKHLLAVEKNSLSLFSLIGGDYSELDNLMAAALLHDFLEDIDGITFDYIRENFNIEIATIVDNLTKRKGEHFESYIERVVSHKLSRLIKASDSNHNSQANRFENPSEANINKCAEYDRLSKRLIWGF